MLNLGRAPTGSKITALCLARVLKIRWFDPIAEVSELPDHLRSAPLLRRLVTAGPRSS